MTDFENAALVTFIVLLTRAIMTYNLNLLIPISNVSKKENETMVKLLKSIG
jgi:glutamate--cysteine ligase catalytic subunit